MAETERATGNDPAQAQDERIIDEGHNAHSAEPAEGARQPGEAPGAATPPHPDQPAEGER